MKTRYCSTYQVNGTAALKPVNRDMHVVTAIASAHSGPDRRESAEQVRLFDERLSVKDVFDNPEGFSPYATVRDNALALGTGIVGIIVFFLITILTSI